MLRQTQQKELSMATATPARGKQARRGRGRAAPKQRNGRPKTAAPAVNPPPIANHYFLVVDGDDDAYGSVHYDPLSAQRECKHVAYYKVKKIDFVPVDTENRYVIVTTVWCPVSPPDFEGAEDKDCYSRYYNWFRKHVEGRLEHLPRPTSLVDVPACIIDPGSTWDRGGIFKSRDEALAYAAEQNAKLDYRDWFVIAEIGAPVEQSYCEVILSPDTSIGTVENVTRWPIRLVLPTDEELARFPVPATAQAAKGGAA